MKETIFHFWNSMTHLLPELPFSSCQRIPLIPIKLTFRVLLGVKTHLFLFLLTRAQRTNEKPHQKPAGWKVIGYPGPSHHSGGYSAPQLIGEEPIKPVWELPH